MATKRKTPKRAKENSELLAGGTATLEVRRVLPADLIGLFSDQFIVSGTAHEVILSFLQTQHPLAASPEEFERIEAIEARCVARIIVTPEQARLIELALRQNLARRAKAKGDINNVDDE